MNTNATRTRHRCVAISLVAVLVVAPLVWWALVRGEESNQSPNGVTDSLPNAVTGGSDASKTAVWDKEMTELHDMFAEEVDRSLLGQRINKGLPPVPPLRQVQNARMANESVAELVRNMGDPWSVFSEDTFNISPSFTSALFLTQSFTGNMRILTLIQKGRDAPGEVVPEVARDASERIRSWKETVKKYRELSAAGVPLGIVSAHDGPVMGRPELRAVLESGYTIPAEFFILANVPGADGLQIIAEYERQRMTFASDYSNLAVDDSESRRLLEAGRTLDTNMAFLAAATFLERNADPQFDAARQRLQNILGDRPASVSVSVSTPNAAMSSRDSMAALDRLDTSAEPTMSLVCLNPDVARTLLTTEGSMAMESLFLLIAQAAGTVP